MNYYDILKVDTTTSTNEIKQSFKILAKKYHPDLNKEPNAQENFILIFEAYSILIDVNKRKTYDDIIKYRENNIFKENLNNWTYEAKKEANYYSKKPYKDFESKFESTLLSFGFLLNVIGMMFVPILFLLLMGIETFKKYYLIAIIINIIWILYIVIGIKKNK